MATSVLSPPAVATLVGRFRSADEDPQERDWIPADIIMPSPAPVLTRADGQTKQESTSQHKEERQLPTSGNVRPDVMPIEIDPLIRLLGKEMRDRRFKVLHQWEGVVSEIGIDSLYAELLDLTDPAKAREIVELPLEDFPDADRCLLVPGCVFYWIIGYLTSEGGQKSRMSEIRIRRNPKWSQHDITSIKSRGEELYQRFTGSAEDSPT